MQKNAKQEVLPKEIRVSKAYRDTYSEGVISLRSNGKAVTSALEAIATYKGVENPTLGEYRELVKDLVYTRGVLGFNHWEFFSYGMEGKTVEQWAQYLSNRELVTEVYPKLNTSWRDAHRLGNKFLTYKQLTPYFKRKIVRYKKDEPVDELIAFASEFDSFIVKPTGGAIGRGIHVVKVADYESPEACARAVAEEGGVVCEELIKQHHAIAALHPQSVNTIRVYSYFDGRTVEVLAPCIRVGRGDSVIDNTGQGGVSAAIDAQTGVITHDGCGKAAEVFECHPDTGIRFKGFQIPQWEGLRQTLRAIAPTFPGVPLIAWDLSLTENDGWAIVEGNEQGQICCTQIRTKEPMRAELLAMLNWDARVNTKGKIADLKLGWTEALYNGKPHKHSKVAVTAKVEDDTVELVEGTDFDLVYRDAEGKLLDAPVAAGVYSATVICKGSYRGIASKKVSVLPNPVKITSAALKGDAATVSWTVPAGAEDEADGVMVSLSQDKEFSQFKQVVVPLGSTSCTVDGLPADAPCFARVRAYKGACPDSEDALVSRWSRVVDVKAGKKAKTAGAGTAAGKGATGKGAGKKAKKATLPEVPFAAEFQGDVAEMDALPFMVPAGALQDTLLNNIRLTQGYRDLFVNYVLERYPSGKGVARALEAIAAFKRVENPALDEYRELVGDLLYTSGVMGFNNWEFFAYGMEGKTVEEWGHYLSNRELMNEIYPRVNTGSAEAHLLGNKYLTYQTLQPYFKREIVLHKKNDPIETLLPFVSAHEDFIVKPVGGAIGHGIHVVKVSDYASPRACATALAEEGSIICEELIKQHAAVAALHPSSVNTIRIYTYFDGQDVTILAPCIRVGRGDSVVDNTGQGGVSAAIDAETGIIEADGNGKASETFECHPDTGIRFKGYQIPFWDDLRQTLKEIAPKFPGVPLIAWDMSLTENDGWAIVEGNEQGQICYTQIRTKRPMRDALLSLVNWEVRSQAKGFIFKAKLGWTRKVSTGEPLIHDEEVIGKTRGGSLTLKRGEDYTLTYTDASGEQVEAPIAAGMYTATVAGCNGYVGSVTKEIEIEPARSKVVSLKAEGTTIHVEWEPIAGAPASADGVFVYYATKRDFSNAKRFPIACKVASAWDIKDLRPDTTYYVRVCSYKKLDEKGVERLLSPFSAAKRVKTGSEA